MWAILEALEIYLGSPNAIGWVSDEQARLWKFQFSFNEIKQLSSLILLVFCFGVHSVTNMADALAKQGVHRVVAWIAFVI